MDETIYICKDCTSNTHLKVYIQEHSNSIEIEKCLYCGGEKQKAIAIAHLAEHVRICIEKLYHKKKEKEYEFLDSTQNESDQEALEEDISTGLKEDSDTADKSLDKILCEEVFSQSFVSQGNQKILLGFVAHMGFANLYEYLERNDCFNRRESNKQTLWSEFVNISKYSNRYFTPKNGRREDILNQLSAMFVACETEIKQGQSFYRVRSVKVSEIKGLKDLTRTQRERKLWEDQIYSNNTIIENLSMPAPIEVSKDNRMSPRGISYCYLASDEKLGLAENRVCNHDDVLIATFKTKKSLRILDFSKSQRTWVDIFWDKYKIDNQQEQGFIENFVDAISKPIHENERNIEYIPTQVLAEYIRYLGYDGIAYSSSLAAGINYVLFCGPAPEKSEEHKTSAITDIPPYSEYLEFENAKWYTVQVKNAYTLIESLFKIGK